MKKLHLISTVLVYRSNILIIDMSYLRGQGRTYFTSRSSLKIYNLVDQKLLESKISRDSLNLISRNNLDPAVYKDRWSNTSKAG